MPHKQERWWLDATGIMSALTRCAADNSPCDELIAVLEAAIESLRYGVSVAGGDIIDVLEVAETYLRTKV